MQANAKKKSVVDTRRVSFATRWDGRDDDDDDEGRKEKIEDYHHTFLTLTHTHTPAYLGGI